MFQLRQPCERLGEPEHRVPELVVSKVEHSEPGRRFSFAGAPPKELQKRLDGRHLQLAFKEIQVHQLARHARGVPNLFNPLALRARVVVFFFWISNRGIRSWTLVALG